MPAPLPYIFRWNRQGSKGQPCEVLVRARAMNSCLVRFADGYTMITSRNATAKHKPTAIAQRSLKSTLEAPDADNS